MRRSAACSNAPPRCIAPPAVARSGIRCSAVCVQRSLCATQRSWVRSRPYKLAPAFLDYAHCSPPDWAHTSPPLHKLHLPPTSAAGPSRSLAHLYTTAKESIPSPHLHRNRVHPPPTSVPPLLPSGTSASAQHRCDAAAQHNVLQPHAQCCNRVPPLHDRSRCGRHLLQPAARCCAAEPLAASDSSKRSEGGAGRIAWRARGTVDEDWLRRKRGRPFDCPEYSICRESMCHLQ